MGKAYSKEETVIEQNNIVQNHLTKYNLSMIIVAVLLSVIIVIMLLRHYSGRLKEWLRRQVSRMMAESAVTRVQQSPVTNFA